MIKIKLILGFILSILIPLIANNLNYQNFKHRLNLRRIKAVKNLPSLDLIEHFIQILPRDSEAKRALEIIQKLYSVSKAYSLRTLSQLPKEIINEIAEIIIEDLINLYSQGKLNAEDYLRAIAEFINTDSRQKIIEEIRKLADKIPYNVAEVVVRKNIKDRKIKDILLKQFKNEIKHSIVYGDGKYILGEGIDNRNVLVLFDALMLMKTEFDQKTAKLIMERLYSINVNAFRTMISKLWVNEDKPFPVETIKKMNKELIDLSVFLEIAIRLNKLRPGYIDAIVGSEDMGLIKAVKLLFATISEKTLGKPISTLTKIEQGEFCQILSFLTKIAITLDKAYILNSFKGGIIASEKLDNLFRAIIAKLFFYSRLDLPWLKISAVEKLAEIIGVQHRMLAYVSTQFEVGEDIMSALLNRESEIMIERSFRLLNDTDIRIRSIISDVLSLWRFQKRANIHLLISTLLSLAIEANPYISSLAAQALGTGWLMEYKQEEIENLLISLLDDPNSLVSKRAAIGLSQILLNKIVPLFEEYQDLLKKSLEKWKKERAD